MTVTSTYERRPTGLRRLRRWLRHGGDIRLRQRRPVGFFVGQIDVVAVHPTALAQTSVTPDFEASGRTVPEGPDPPTDTYGSAVVADSPASYWRLDESSGVQAADSSGTDNGAAYRRGAA